jgi:NAD(P)-dependent dehydrogenase (short-subunit alcohol dehydrogenase family)
MMSEQVDSRPPVCLIIGVGPGISTGAAKAFARQGYSLALVRRNSELLQENLTALQQEFPQTNFKAYPTDARVEQQVIELFDNIEKDLGVPSIVIANIANFSRNPLVNESADKFREVWEGICFAGFLIGREAARRMVPLSRGTIIFTGATG